MNALDDPTRPLPTLTLTLEENVVTVLDHLSDTRARSLENAVKDALLFLVLYVRTRHTWPAELRSPCAG